jgi:lipoprotein NlpD
MNKYLSILLMVSTLAGCQHSGEWVPVAETGEKKSAKSNRSVHKVRAGDTLYSIAWRYSLDYRDLAKLNKIKPPFTIFIDQRLKLGLPKSGPKKSPKPEIKVNPVVKAPAKTPATVKPQKLVKSPVDVKWYWPVDGEVVSGFSLRGDMNKGLDIAGKHGQSVVSAAGGTVVYAGGGIRGYGKLVIIKHNDHFLSAYANNSDILVKEGDQVRHGQVIARLGPDGSGKEVLHFEIRRDGKPEDPLKYLPKKKQ